MRVGFLGAGSASVVHAASLRELDGVVIAAVCSRNLSRAEEFCLRHAKEARSYDNWEVMLEDQHLDALYVALPPGAHAGQAEAAADRGIALMLEKPIALTESRAESIQESVVRNGVKCQIGFQFRHSAPVIHLRRMIEDGSAGRPLFMQARFFTNDLFSTWWRDPNLGGGQLIEQAIHHYDLARHFLGEPVVVTSMADNLSHARFPDYQVDDVSASTIRFRSGAIASICASNNTAPGDSSIAFSVHCERVSAEFKSPDDAVFSVHRGAIPRELLGNEDAVRREFVSNVTSANGELSRNFIAAIRNEEATRSDVRDGVESLRLVLRAAASAKAGGRPVDVVGR